MSFPADPREQILARLVVLAKGIGGMNPKHVFRNKLRIADELLPAISILDGDETPDDSSYGRGRSARGPIIMTMRPEIYGFVKGDEESVGQDMNALRAALIKAITTDATLLGLCKDGDVRYEGFASGMANGRSMEGEMGLAFAFVYVLRPAAL